MHLCFFFMFALSSQTPSPSRQTANQTEPGSAGGFFLLNRSFPFCYHYIHAEYEGLLQSQRHNGSSCSLLPCAHPGGVRVACQQRDAICWVSLDIKLLNQFE
ncbi:hypothetical protein AMECASPLE_016788 [Ameca splendens]|uniref:Secreted protein n=1 Tax=Ameca splendens TaxID=208324 RepID=A0ABV0YDS5_9TELE